MLNIQQCCLTVVDVQGKLAQTMYQKQALLENLQKFIRGVKALTIPIIWMEQNPGGLGPTIPEVAKLLQEIQPMAKLSFSCCGHEQFRHQLSALNRKQVLLCGIETHVCVYQTAIDLINLGYDVQTVTDATSSRTAENRQIGLEGIKDAGAKLTSTEMVLFELLKVARGEIFKKILKIIK